MSAGALTPAVTTLLPVAAQTTAAQGALGAARNVIETADYSLIGRLVRVDLSRKRTRYGVSIKAHWFPKMLRVLLEVNSPAEARAHVLLEMQPGERSTGILAMRRILNGPSTSGPKVPSVGDSVSRISWRRRTSGRDKGIWEK